jgi:hypothetical protein
MIEKIEQEEFEESEFDLENLDIPDSVLNIEISDIYIVSGKMYFPLYRSLFTNIPDKGIQIDDTEGESVISLTKEQAEEISELISEDDWNRIEATFGDYDI